MKLTEKIANEQLYSAAHRVLNELCNNSETAGEYQFITKAQELLKKAKRERLHAKKIKKMQKKSKKVLTCPAA